MSAGPDWWGGLGLPDFRLPEYCDLTTGPGGRGEVCDICRNNMESTTLTITHTPCDNSYCQNCFIYHYTSSEEPLRCPHCRADLTRTIQYLIQNVGELAKILNPSRDVLCMTKITDFITTVVSRPTLSRQQYTARVNNPQINTANLHNEVTPMMTPHDILTHRLRYGLTQDELDSLWLLTNIWGIENFYCFAQRIGEETLYFFLPNSPSVEVCANIEQVQDSVPNADFYNAINTHATIQTPLPTEMVRSFLRSRTRGLPVYAQAEVDKVNNMEREDGVRHWVVLRIAGKLFVCPWPANQLPNPLAPMAFMGWTQGRYSDDFDDTHSQDCLTRFESKLQHQTAHQELAEDEALRFWGPKCIGKIHDHQGKSCFGVEEGTQ